MVGEYYDNEDFIGAPKHSKDEDVNFDWSGDHPLKGINPDNFSVRWVTYLRVPISGEYVFRTESDDGNSLYLNSHIIISHFMGATGKNRDAGDSFLEADEMNFDAFNKKVIKN